MTFNLRFGLADDGPNSWDFRKESVSCLFKTFLPDFICLQEVNPFQINFLTSVLHDFRYIGMYQPSSHKWQDNLIFFKKEWLCFKYDHFFLSDTPWKKSSFSGSQWPRQATYGVFRKNHHLFALVNTHFDFEAQVQEKSSALIVSSIKDKCPNMPVIVAGDFNADQNSSAHDIFMKSGFMDPLSMGSGHTFHGFDGSGKGGRIDWIIYKGNLSPVSSEILSSAFGGQYPSDHFPVLAEFILY